MQNNLNDIKMKKQTYKRIGNCGLFDCEENTAKLDSLGNPLEKLSKVIDFEMFRETLEAGLYKEKLIKKSVTTSAEQHDSVPTRLLIDGDDYGQELYVHISLISLMNSPICNRSESLLRQCRIKMPMTTQWPTMMAKLPSGLTAIFFKLCI